MRSILMALGFAALLMGCSASGTVSAGGGGGVATPTASTAPSGGSGY